MEPKEKQPSKFPPATILTVFAALLSGGFAGALFTWYVNRPQPTVLTYAVTTTSLGTSEVSSVVPNLKIQIGSENIDALYTHTIELIVAKGPFADQAEFAIGFPSEARIFGMRTDAPSAMQSISCSPIPTGSKCRLGPLSSKVSKPFRVAIATNKREWPSVDLVAKNIELVSAPEYLRRSQESIFSNIPVWLEVILFIIMATGVLGIVGMLLDKLTKKAASDKNDRGDVEQDIPHY